MSERIISSKNSVNPEELGIPTGAENAVAGAADLLEKVINRLEKKHPGLDKEGDETDEVLEGDINEVDQDAEVKKVESGFVSVMNDLILEVSGDGEEE